MVIQRYDELKLEKHKTKIPPKNIVRKKSTKINCTQENSLCVEINLSQKKIQKGKPLTSKFFKLNLQIFSIENK